MQELYSYVSPPSPCGYLPERDWSLEYIIVSELSEDEYQQHMIDGWRRFGRAMFHPVCPACDACRPIRIPTATFRPNRSQRRVRKRNEGSVELRIVEPSVSREKLDLYDVYHAYQAEVKDWPHLSPRDPGSYVRSFVEHPFPVEEWLYYIDDELVGVGYVDHLPPARKLEGGLSAIYFFYDPDHCDRSLGTWNVLCILEEARRRGIPHVYLGYYVEGCRSMEYKSRFLPNEVRRVDGEWQRFSR